MSTWRRIYISKRAKETLEQYGMHNNYNFNNTIWYLIQHNRYCTDYFHCKCRREMTHNMLQDLNQPSLDTFGREMPTDSVTSQDSTKEEK